MYARHIGNDDPMTMIVDPDVDGMTSAALFINYTYRLFPAYVQNKITYLCHTGKQHGLNDMMEWIPQDTKFLVMIDSSSNDYEYHQQLAERGIDILVIDHHEADKISEYACVINNQLCNYPNKALSGVGIAYKFCCYLDRKLGIYNAHDFEDLVSIGNIADMVDVRSIETRYLITEGLKDIQNPLIKEIADRQAHQFEGGITPMGAAFYIAPFINAVMRSGTL
ncbi:MAG: DHH family phosphoesterase, partial [Lachnospiraceae bacterium]|nr:DHH family phosphoesterase [Lachnospiraceae bacterium]